MINQDKSGRPLTAKKAKSRSAKKKKTSTRPPLGLSKLQPYSLASHKGMKMLHPSTPGVHPTKSFNASRSAMSKKKVNKSVKKNKQKK
jgi:hypothetical protein